MARKYSKQILSDELADLGKELGRTPMPSDLKPGMAVKKTYLRWFGDWDTALEYAGYTKEVREETDVKQPVKTIEKAASHPENPAPKPAAKSTDPYHPDNIQLINLYAPKVVLAGEDGMTSELPHRGTAMATFSPITHARAEILLKHLTCKTRIIISEKPVELYLLRPDGVKEIFPGMVAGVYYLVSRKFAMAARDFGRTTLDLIYPGLITSSHRNPTKIIARLEMLHHPKLWWTNP